MAESSTLFILRAKASEIEAAISRYERQIELARRDLIAVGATINIFERATGTASWSASPMSVSKLFKRGDVFKIVVAALQDAPGGLDTRELATICLKTRGFEEDNLILRRSMAMNIVNVLSKAKRRGKVAKGEMRDGVLVWRAP